MTRILCALSAVLASYGIAQAEGLHAIRPLSGYVCMQLALSPEENKDPTRSVPVRDTPSLSVPVSSWAPSLLVVPNPQQPTAGFLQVVFSDGHRGWVRDAALKLWRSPTNPDRRCLPSIMSNGLIGFDFK